MYFELTAPDRLSMERAYWDAQVLGLDPVALTPLTFNIGTAAGCPLPSAERRGCQGCREAGEASGTSAG